jgi:hypothetical protein
VNDETSYGLYKVGADTTADTNGAATFTPVKDPSGVGDGTSTDVLKITSDKSKVIPTAITFTSDGTSVAKVTAQPTDASKLYIGADQITAAIYDKDGKVVKTLASQPVTVAKRFNAKGVAAITGDASYGSNKTNAKATLADASTPTYDITGYDVVNVDTAITLTDVAVGNVTEPDTVSSAVEIKVVGGTVGKITSAGAVTISDDKDKKVTTSVASVAAKGAVTVSNDEVACSVGSIASNDAVTVDGSKTTVGDVRAKGEIKVGTTAPGATTGSLTGVATTATETTALTKDYPDVTVTGSTVNGDIVGNDVTVAGVDAKTIDDTAVPATVNGNITIYSDTTANDVGSVTVGNPTASSDYRVADVTVGNITAANAGSTITVKQGTAGDGKTTSTTTVGTLNGFVPEKTADTTEVDFVNYTGSFASLPNFTTVSIDADSDVKVASALATTELTVNGTAELAGGATVEDAVSGTGTLKMPAGKLIAKTSIGASATPINFVPTSAVKVGDVLFSSMAGQAANVAVEGVTIDSKASSTVANGYDYYAKAVKGTGLSITGDAVADSKTTVASGSAKTLTASVLPTGQTLPEGESIAWTLTYGDRNIAITPSSDTLSATVTAKAYDAKDTNSVNEDTVTAYVVDANGTRDINYKPATCAITATPAVTLTTTVTDLDGNVINATSDTVVKIQQSTELRVHFNADKAGISDIKLCHR